MDELTRLVIDVARRHATPDLAGSLTDADSELRDAGLESLDLVAVVVELESELGVAFPSELMNTRTFATPRSIAAALRTLSRS